MYCMLCIAGVLEPEPVRQVKESTELVVGELELYEVTGEGLPSILTNHPTFFTSHNREEISVDARGSPLLQ